MSNRAAKQPSMAVRARADWFLLHVSMDGGSQVDDLDIPLNELAESARRIVERALEDARRREHSMLTSALWLSKSR
jgi:hypothetical protein